MKNISILVIVLITCGCGSTPKQDVATSEQVTASSGATLTDSTTVWKDSIDVVSSATAIENQVSFNGTLVMPPQNFATITLSMAGIVRSTVLLSGDYVKKGAVLVTLENPEFISLQQTYLDSRAQTEFLEKEYVRQRTLSDQEASSLKRVEQSKADYLSMKSRADAAAAQLAMLGFDESRLKGGEIVRYLDVKAPISGYVSNVKMNLGKHIAAGETLCEIVDKSRILLKLIAYEKDLSKLEVGQKIEFKVNGMADSTFDAVLISVGQSVDDVNRSLEVYARVDKCDPQFRQGMYATARIVR